VRRAWQAKAGPTTTAGNATEWYAAQARQSGWAGLTGRALAIEQLTLMRRRGRTIFSGGRAVYCT